MLFTTSTGTGDANDVFITALAELGPGGTTTSVIQEYPLNVLGPDTAETQVFNTNVVVMGVDAADIGLTGARSSFRYDVLSTSLTEDAVFDLTAPLSYDVVQPGLEFGGGVFGLPTYEDLDGGTIPYTYSRSRMLAQASYGFLLLHHHNRSGDRAEWRSFDSVAPAAALRTGLGAIGVGAAGADFTVTYTDDLLVRGASFDDGDLLVTGPGGYSAPATFVSATPAGNGVQIVATYRVEAPGGTWDRSESGAYAVTVVAGQVLDSGANGVPAGALGTLTADVRYTSLLPLLAK